MHQVGFLLQHYYISIIFNDSKHELRTNYIRINNKKNGIVCCKIKQCTIRGKFKTELIIIFHKNSNSQEKHVFPSSFACSTGIYANETRPAAAARCSYAKDHIQNSNKAKGK